MKTEYLKNQLLLRTEQDNEFVRNIDLLQIRLLDAIYTEDQSMLMKLLETFTCDSFIHYVSGDLEITKMYFAAFYSDLIERVKSFGLPASVASDLKKHSFQKLASIQAKQDLADLSILLFQQIFKLYQLYSFERFSYPVQQAVQQIHNLKMQRITPGTIADGLKMDRTYLSRKFHEETGKTLTDYIHCVKMDLAESLILGKNYSLREISDLLGYDSYSYFSKIFRKYKGCLPSHLKFPHIS